MLSCKDISHLASDHIDDNLSFFMKMKVKMHLFMCHKCRDFIRQFRTTVNTLKQVKPATEDPQAVDLQVQKLIKIREHIKPDIDRSQ
ncbi:MAG: zf-HC2 domain-containing protein [Gammaproteobacteria bacterium]|nr:zf-HC2 domain-containing protein [Gammaproteobacteria bacterium]